MKFSCEKSIISEAVSVGSRAVSAKTTIPVLEGLLISADKEIKITGYNLKTGISSSFDAEIIEPGAVVLNGRIFGDIIRKLPDDVVEISVDEKLMATIKCGMTEYNILGQSASEFPEMPEVSRGVGIEVPYRTLKSMISETIFAVSDNENKPIHTGSLFDFSENILTVVSVDGYRLALRREAVDRGENQKPCSFVVPGSALREIEKIMPDNDKTALLFPDSKHILFVIENIVVTSRLLEGEFLNYKNAVPKDHPVVFVGDVSSITESVERVSLIISEKLKNPVRCVFSDHVVKFSCITAIGKAYDECAVEGSADEIEIGFNNRYLLDAFHALKVPSVRIELKSGLSPCVLKPVEGDSFLFLVLPVRLRANE